MKQSVKKHRIVAGLLSVVMLFGLNGCGDDSEAERVDWTILELGDVLPQPKSKTGEIHTNTESDLWVDISKTSETEYKEYIEACKEKGFTIDSESSSIGFSAYNADGYKLDLTHYKSSEEISIRLNSPMEMSEIQWPKSEIGTLLPIPKSTVGQISWEASYGFVIYIGETTKEEYNAYVDECWERGFTLDYHKGDTSFWADNEDGYHVSLKYEGNNIMFIRIDEPDEVKTETTDEPESVPKAEETPTQSSESGKDSSLEDTIGSFFGDIESIMNDAADDLLGGLSGDGDSNATTGEKNALRSAKEYLAVMPFSYTGLINQLKFEGYSTEEATYGADNCGADWNEQAAKSAKSYLDIMSFSRSGLIEQLEFEGYTHEQAVYGAEANGY